MEIHGPIVDGGEPSQRSKSGPPSGWRVLAMLVPVVAFGVATVTPIPGDHVTMAEQIRPPGLTSTLTVLDPNPRTEILVVPTPLDERVATHLTTVSGGTAQTAMLDYAISAGVGRGLLGVGDQRLRIVGRDVVYISLGETVILPLDTLDEPIAVGTGVYLLPSGSDGRVWVVGSGARWVRHLDVASRSTGPEIRLGDIGRPLAGVTSGLVMSLRAADPGALALRNELGEVEPLHIDPVLEFVAAAGDTVVLSDGDSLLVHDITDGTTRSLAITHAEHARSNEFIISPSGTRIAIVERGTLTDLPRVRVYDLHGGREVMEIDPALGWQLQWISEDDILYLDPTGGEYALSIADVDAGSSRRTIGLSNSAIWFAGSTAP